MIHAGQGPAARRAVGERQDADRADPLLDVVLVEKGLFCGFADYGLHGGVAEAHSAADGDV